MTTKANIIRTLKAALTQIEANSGFSFDDLGFDGFGETPHVATPVSETRKAFQELKRGDVVTVGRTKWVIRRSVGDLQAYAYKHPSKHNKLYEIRADQGDDAVVFEIGGSAQRLGADVARGPLRLTSESVSLD
jgi:hypothetical protein